MLNWPSEKNGFEAGCDEAGRGCLAGPVVAAAVVLKPGLIHPDLNDSKLLSPVKREELRAWIEEKAIDWSYAVIAPQIIDEINILNATFRAMHSALDKLKIMPDFILVDGNRFLQYNNIPYECIVKGDRKIACIAAASIIAKCHRDRIMEEFHDEFPVYLWKENKGYASGAHIEAIDRNGLSKYHRRSFHLKRQLKFNFNF